MLVQATGVLRLPPLTTNAADDYFLNNHEMKRALRGLDMQICRYLEKIKTLAICISQGFQALLHSREVDHVEVIQCGINFERLRPCAKWRSRSSLRLIVHIWAWDIHSNVCKDTALSSCCNVNIIFVVFYEKAPC